MEYHSTHIGVCVVSHSDLIIKRSHCGALLGILDDGFAMCMTLAICPQEAGS
jgi:hypothetical protein